MKLNQDLIDEFEKTQASKGIEVAMSNLIFEVGYSVLRIVGVKSIKVKYNKKAKAGFGTP